MPDDFIFELRYIFLKVSKVAATVLAVKVYVGEITKNIMAGLRVYLEITISAKRIEIYDLVCLVVTPSPSNIEERIGCVCKPS